MQKGLLLLALVMVACSPVHARAAVTITEIMYNPAGGDAKHEWIEVLNSGEAVDLSQWKLFEGGSNHGLEVYAGSATLSSGGYAIIADDPATFLADYPGFSGTLFNTALSSGLNNAIGETITLRDATLTDHESVTYAPLPGADDTGDSLQKIDNVWQAAKPTPGLTGVVGTSAQPGAAPSAGSSPTQATPAAPAASPVAEPTIVVGAGDDRTVVAGAAVYFSASVLGIKKEPIENARIVWSFGNGEVREGHAVFYTFSIPGTYAVTANASSGFLSDSDRVVVTVIPAQVSLGRITADFIEVTNGAAAELDLGLWQLSAGEKIFVFPRDTVILPHQTVAISNKATGLMPVGVERVALLYPNGALAATGTYREPLFVAAPRKEVVVAVAKIGPKPEPESPPVSALAAAVTSAPPTPSNVWWYLALIALIVVGCAGAYFLQKKTHDS